MYDSVNGGAQYDPELNDIITSYFTYCHNQPFSFFHEQTFRKRLTEGTLTSHLLLAVLCHGLRYSNHWHQSNRNPSTAEDYADQSWKSVISQCLYDREATDLATVQTITLLAIFDFTGKNPNPQSLLLLIQL